jgi:hypothetical protein
VQKRAKSARFDAEMMAFQEGQTESRNVLLARGWGGDMRPRLRPAFLPNRAWPTIPQIDFV